MKLLQQQLNDIQTDMIDDDYNALSDKLINQYITDLSKDRMHYIACIAQIDKTIAYINNGCE